MSYCVCTMQKMKMSAMGGMQSHNQREHESRKNREIDAERTPYNYELVNDGHLHYVRAVKDRIAELNLPKAVRKDAVVACSFIIGSDREWHDDRAKKLHNRQGHDGRAWDDLSEAEQTKLIADATRSYYEDAVLFLQNRYGKENVLAASVHVDEVGAPHMHVMVVPVTKEGRLSAKDRFTPLELKSLQTDFWERVGRKYDLERGREGSDVKHLDEVTYKLKVRSEELDEVTEQLNIVDSVLQDTIEQNREEGEELQNVLQELKTTKEALASLQGEMDALNAVIGEIRDEFEQTANNLVEKKKELSEAMQDDVRLMKQFVERPDISASWEMYKSLNRRAVEQKVEISKDDLVARVERIREQKRQEAMKRIQNHKRNRDMER